MRRRSSLVLWLVLVGWLGCTVPSPTIENDQLKLGTGLFEPAVSLAVGSSASAMAIADVNGDASNEVLMTTDYVYGDPNNYQLLVFRHAANGAMQEIARYTIGRGAESMSVGDVNGDGRNDVVVANSDSDTIGILYQNAGGTLDPMVTISTTSSLRVRVADLNSDGRQDIVGINWGTDVVDLFLQDQQGQLTGRATYHVTHGGYDDLEIGDVNHDGRTDIVVMSGQAYAIPSFGVLLQTPQGTFAAPTYYSVGTNILTHGVAIGDVNGDGWHDVIVSYGGNRPSSQIGVFIQNQAGGLNPVQSLTSYDIPAAVIAADVDHNGATDVLVLHSGWNAVGVYSQSTPGFLDPEVRYTTQSASNSPDGLAIGDFTGDGLPDLAIADYNYGLVTLKHLAMPADTQPPTVTMGEPTGRVAQVGAPLPITWTASDNVGVAGFDVVFSTDGGATTTPIAECTGLGPAIRACTWAAPGPASPTALVRVVVRDSSGNTASADAAFVLQPPPDTQPPAVTVGEPTGSIAYVGMPLHIVWTASDNVALGAFDVLYSTDGGVSTTAIAECTGLGPDVRSCTWAAPGPASTTALVRVVARDTAGNTASADGAFVLEQPTLTLSAGPLWQIGTLQSLTWSHNLPAIDTMLIEMSRNGGNSWEALASSTPNTGSYVTTVTGPEASDARLRITWLANPLVQATATIVIVAPPPINTPPTVNAGTDQAITLPATVSLAGTTADDGLPNPPGAVTTTWSMIDGPGTVIFANAALLSTTATFSTAGSYTLRLTASDGALSATDDVMVSVIAAPVNQAPVVNAGADKTVTLPALASMVGTATDDGLPNPPAQVAVTWSKVSGPGTVTFANASTLSTTAIFSAPGSYTLRLTASDGSLSASDNAVITVNPSPATPCSSLCSNPVNFTINGTFQSRNLGTGAVCYQTTSTIKGGNCGNLVGQRKLTVNGTTESCNGRGWSSIPAKRNGGYCVQTTAGNHPWAYFTAW